MWLTGKKTAALLMPPRSLLEGHQRSSRQPSVRGGVGSCPRDCRTAWPSAGSAWGHGVWGWGRQGHHAPDTWSSDGTGRDHPPRGPQVPCDLQPVPGRPQAHSHRTRPLAPLCGLWEATLPSRWPPKEFCSSVSLLASPLPVLEHESQASLKDLPCLLGARHAPPPAPPRAPISCAVPSAERKRGTLCSRCQASRLR